MENVTLLTNAAFVCASGLYWPENHKTYNGERNIGYEHRDENMRSNIYKGSFPDKEKKAVKEELDQAGKTRSQKSNQEAEWGDLANLSKKGDRIEFQIQGHQGPKSYIFGFDTGHGKNRQYRLEEKFPGGTVRGQYGYYDAKGKLRVVQYISRPIEGYEERHHESSIPT